MSDNPASSRSIHSLDRAAAILQALAVAPEGLTLKSLAAHCHLLPQTTQSLLRTLQLHEWVSQSGRAAPYALGPGLPRLAQCWLAAGGPTAVARDIVVHLSQQLGEYVLLAELRGRTLRPLLEERAERPVMVGGISWGPDRLHAMATGKLLLAFLDPAEQESIVTQLPLPARGPRSIVDRRQFIEDLRTIRKNGVAVCREENGEDIAALAVPVFDATRSARAALGICVPLSRFTPRYESELLGQLLRAAQELSRRWGGPLSRPASP